MMTRVLLTFLVGLVVSLGTLVSGVEPVLAKNWNLSKEEKERGEFLSFNDERLCLAATGRGERVKQRHDHSAAAHAKFKDVDGFI